jgi:hypothetical protein
LIQHPGDEQAFAGKKTHGTSAAKMAEVSHGLFGGAMPWGAGAAGDVAATDGRAYNPPFAECRVGGSSSPFFLARRFQARYAVTVTAR